MRRVIDTWVNRPPLDYLLAILAALVAVWRDPQGIPATEQLGVWFQTLASVNGALLALGGVALTIVFTVTPTKRLQLVYEATGERLSVLVMACLGALALTTVGFVALFLVPPSSSAVRNGLTALLVVLAGQRFVRLWWLFRRVLSALMAKETGEASDVVRPIRTTQHWERPTVETGDYSLTQRKARKRRK